MTRFIKISAFFFLIFCAVSVAPSQSKARKKKPDAKIVNTGQSAPAEREASPAVFPAKSAAKKNGRPDATEPAGAAQNKIQPERSIAPQIGYRYEFSQPNFTVKSIVIELDESGKGKISFEKKNYDAPVSDPVQLSSLTLEKIKNLHQALNFLDSTENYQSPERDYKHLGTVKLARLAGEKNRTAEFNWTENLDARALADEYRRISNQWIWMFDISLSRENQPLEAPGLMDALDSLIRRNEISDPAQMLPFLRELGNDERIPLMARNRAAKIIKEIEKKAAK